MKIIIAAALGALALAAAAPAAARDGCGRDFFRGPRGHCRPMVGPGTIAPGLIVGNFYNGRGYWDGRRYYQHRHFRHGGYRYR